MTEALTGTLTLGQRCSARSRRFAAARLKNRRKEVKRSDAAAGGSLFPDSAGWISPSPRRGCSVHGNRSGFTKRKRNVALRGNDEALEVV